MGKQTGIAWTDSTHNPWWGCTKVAEQTACAGCYAEDVDKRSGGGHWGHGAPRRLLSEHARNEPYRWNRQADAFFAEHGRDRRVFTLSMGDLFDNEVEPSWRRDHMRVMTDCTRLKWQICTKRVSNLPKMVPAEWHSPDDGISWPQHVGVLITVVTQAEADRDVPRLLGCKRKFGIPWVGISYEPAQEAIDWTGYLDGSRRFNSVGEDITSAIIGGERLDWLIFGGKSGRNWNDRPFSLDWARQTRDQCAATGVAFFMKQVAAFRPTEAMIPDDLRIRQFPEALR